jgi:rSAM/selenodomain-associated transferase 1
MPAENCIILFIKYPEKGKVKSRLAEDLDDDIVLLLYQNFVLDLLDTLKKGRHPFTICFYPPDAEGKVAEWLGKDYTYKSQNGKDLGERMKNAFLGSFAEGYSKVLIVGSDIPDITNNIIEEAFSFDHYHAVIGPAYDGGYYLIGFRNNTFLPAIFDAMPWGTENVFEKTMEIFRKNNYNVHLLTKWRDVDKLDDLRGLIERSKNTDFAGSRTVEFIHKNLEIMTMRDLT